MCTFARHCRDRILRLSFQYRADIFLKLNILHQQVALCGYNPSQIMVGDPVIFSILSTRFVNFSVPICSSYVNNDWTYIAY